MPVAEVLDRACAEAVDLAREAAEGRAGVMGVGEHLGVVADDVRVATHLFACTHPGYPSDRWHPDRLPGLDDRKSIGVRGARWDVPAGRRTLQLLQGRGCDLDRLAGALREAVPEFNPSDDAEVEHVATVVAFPARRARQPQ